MIESKELPEGALITIKKLEQFFGIKLRKEESAEKIKEEVETEKKTEKEPAVILKVNRDNMQNMTISDLVKLKVDQAGLSVSLTLARKLISGFNSSGKSGLKYSSKVDRLVESQEARMRTQ